MPTVVSRGYPTAVSSAGVLNFRAKYYVVSYIAVIILII